MIDVRHLINRIQGLKSDIEYMLNSISTVDEYVEYINKNNRLRRKLARTGIGLKLQKYIVKNVIK